METEKFDNDEQVAPSEIWEQLSDEQRAHVLRLLTRMASQYIESLMEHAEAERITEEKRTAEKSATSAGSQ